LGMLILVTCTVTPFHLCGGHVLIMLIAQLRIGRIAVVCRRNHRSRRGKGADAVLRSVFCVVVGSIREGSGAETCRCKLIIIIIIFLKG